MQNEIALELGLINYVYLNCITVFGPRDASETEGEPAQSSRERERDVRGRRERRQMTMA